jgi:hypothetical protein
MPKTIGGENCGRTSYLKLLMGELTGARTSWCHSEDMICAYLQLRVFLRAAWSRMDGTDNLEISDRRVSVYEYVRNGNFML